jgi:outer membrane protein assembly factor BamB
MREAIGLMAALLAGAENLQSWPAPEASQGVAVDGSAFYAVGNSEIARYDRETGKRTLGWKGDAHTFPHVNSCAVIRDELVCAASNYPVTPMESRVEMFDPVTLKHLRTIPLGQQGGSLTWVDWNDGAWWGGFANYDGRGGEAGRDHTTTKLVKFDAQWKPVATWTYPASVLERISPRSTSGGTFGEDGRLYVTGHDRPELYVLAVPPGGGVLEHLATIPIGVEGQAIALDRGQPGVLFGVRRTSREVVSMRLPAMTASTK